MPEQNTQSDIVVQELKARIGQIVSQYEEQLANLKAEAITLINDRDAQIEQLRSEAQNDDG